MGEGWALTDRRPPPAPTAADGALACRVCGGEAREAGVVRGRVIAGPYLPGAL